MQIDCWKKYRVIFLKSLFGREFWSQLSYCQQVFIFKAWMIGQVAGVRRDRLIDYAIPYLLTPLFLSSLFSSHLHTPSHSSLRHPPPRNTHTHTHTFLFTTDTPIYTYIFSLYAFHLPLSENTASFTLSTHTTHNAMPLHCRHLVLGYITSQSISQHSPHIDIQIHPTTPNQFKLHHIPPHRTTPRTH